MKQAPDTPVLVSACLLGTPCRYDGQSRPADLTPLMQMSGVRLIPVCPERDGGLPTPRTPAERVGDRVINRDSADVTEEYRRGAEIALATAQKEGCRYALLKERSPSCGSTCIYDGNFTGKLISGRACVVRRLKTPASRSIRKKILMR